MSNVKEYSFHWALLLKEPPTEAVFHELMMRLISDGETKFNVWLGGGGSVVSDKFPAKDEYSYQIGGLCYNAKWPDDSTEVTPDLKNEIEEYLRSVPEAKGLVTSPLIPMGYCDSGDKNDEILAEELTDQFYLDRDIQLGPDGPRHCLGSYIWSRGEWREPDGTPIAYDYKSDQASYIMTEHGCAKCRISTDKNGKPL